MEIYHSTITIPSSKWNKDKVGDKKMGSKISLGLVFNKVNNGVILEKVIRSLVNSDNKMNYKFCKDEFGENWIEGCIEISNLSKDMLNAYIQNYYCELTIESRNVIGVYCEIVMRLENKNDYFGILIDIDESDIMAIGYDIAENSIIKYLKNMFDVTNYLYAFCDNEGEIHLSPTEVLRCFNGLYSIFMKPREKIIEIFKGSWKLDGFSER